MSRSFTLNNLILFIDIFLPAGPWTNKLLKPLGITLPLRVIIMIISLIIKQFIYFFISSYIYCYFHLLHLAFFIIPGILFSGKMQGSFH